MEKVPIMPHIQKRYMEYVRPPMELVARKEWGLYLEPGELANLEKGVVMLNTHTRVYRLGTWLQQELEEEEQGDLSIKVEEAPQLSHGEEEEARGETEEVARHLLKVMSLPEGSAASSSGHRGERAMKTGNQSPHPGPRARGRQMSPKGQAPKPWEFAHQPPLQLETRLKGQWHFVLMELEMEPRGPQDLILLWHHLVQTLELEAEEGPKGGPDFNKYNQEQIWQQLNKGKDLLLDGLRGKVQKPASCRNIHLQKAHALEMTDRVKSFHKFRKSHEGKAWPIWLMDRGMENLLKSLLAHWEAQWERWQLAGGDPRGKSQPPLLDQGSPVALEDWLQWLTAVRGVLQRRGQEPTGGGGRKPHQLSQQPE